MADIYKHNMGAVAYDRFVKPKMLFDFNNASTTYATYKHDWKTYSFEFPRWKISSPWEVQLYDYTFYFMNKFDDHLYFDKETQLYSECAKEVDSYLEDFCAKPGGDMRQ
jgi:hypothetical protein